MIEVGNFSEHSDFVDQSHSFSSLPIYPGLGSLQPLVYCGYQGRSPDIMQWDVKMTTQPPPIAKVKNEWRYTSISPLLSSGM
jgi:hypothetical protein